MRWESWVGVAIEVKVTDRRAAEDFAVCMRELTEVGPSASGSFWTICRRTSSARSNELRDLSPLRGAMVLRRLEFHHVPQHASWLNIVEIEIGVLRQPMSRQA